MRTALATNWCACSCAPKKRPCQYQLLVSALRHSYLQAMRLGVLR